ncbi:MAG: zf-HC2 domain-containing protein [bacterium]|nr:MAG: zf-HC2 domain-containing protein [bacterium]
MDSCQRFKEMISDYIEGELDSQNNSQMEKHLRDCLRCKKAISQLKNLIRKLKELPKITVSPDFETILRARISMESSLARRRNERFFPIGQFRLSAYAFSAVVIIVALFAAFFLVKPYRVSAPQASVNNEWYKGGAVKYDPSTNEPYIYIIERESVKNVSSQTPTRNIRYQPTDKKISSDSSQTYKDEKLWFETAQTLESIIY